LEDVDKSGHKVLVYCMTGTSRSPAVITGFLMKLRRWRLAESYKWVKDKRAAINIGVEDTKRLLALEMQLHGSCSVPDGFAALDSAGGGLFSPSPLQTSTTLTDTPAAATTSANPFASSWTFSTAQPAVAFGVVPQPSSTPTTVSPSFVFGGAPQGPENSAEMEM
jgi:dual specificity MAP kinase phosphatase